MNGQAGIAFVVLSLLLGSAAGAAFGWAYFMMLWASVKQLGRRRAGAWFVALLLARLAAALVVLALIGRWGGAPALLGALAGFTVARVVLLRRKGPAPAAEGPSR